ncbi:DUF1566 domain-containing protein [Bacteroides sp. 51]|uniref:Lcl C-terminal domain-containing protein n=1 Tax=Bacteroides sp. 51 TaxID=2302938 RepID=UPI0013D47B07|nr:DUF1566 domain-containing protein [Bacteroides sp. 51]NDV81827.1 DUF1566 domain-containing protein [Bacteroides sp. 51]
MKHILIMILSVSLMIPAGVMAQEAYKDASKVILDLTPGTGMPRRAVTNTPKTWTGTVGLSNLLLDNQADGSINATLYQKLEIAPHDLTGNGTIGSAGTTLNWADAFNFCKNVSHNGTGWRLPTQRELQLISVFRPALDVLLVAVGGTAFDGSHYWSATEATTSLSYIHHFLQGITNNDDKVKLHRIRCVREVTD